jgi:MoaA/NifB/PqqE/SkfB family radical SAM enzyme
MELCRSRKMIFGFSTVCTNTNIDYVGSSVFIDTMVRAGCTLGFYNELIPIEQEDLRFLPAVEQTDRFKKELAVHRKEKPIVLINLPEDEYDAQGRCMAVGRGAMHINAGGWVEPCPFAHYARENINTHSFREILASPFLQALRDHPYALQHGEIGCALVSNRGILEDIARQTGAQKTSAAKGICHD